MKAIMYHYVRDVDAPFPAPWYLPIEGFCRQLDWLDGQFGFATYEQVHEWLAGGRPQGAQDRGQLVLTFDDGLRDHIECVLPELERRHIFGVFFVCSQPLQEGRLLDVHAVHALLATQDASVLLEFVSRFAGRAGLGETISPYLGPAYERHSAPAQVTAFKRLINYELPRSVRRAALTAALRHFGMDEGSLVDQCYMGHEEIRSLAERGHWVGSHGCAHEVLSRLTLPEKRRDLSTALDHLTAAGLLTQPLMYCHPYGGDHSFDPETLQVLHELGFSWAFSVGSADISGEEVGLDRLRLPRYDCNEFPYGLAKRYLRSEPLDQ